MNGLRYLNTLLTVLTVILALQLWTTWTTAGPAIHTQAHAQGIPDSGAQLMQVIDQLKLLNQKTEQVKAVLLSGNLRVRLVGPDEPAEKPNQR